VESKCVRTCDSRTLLRLSEADQARAPKQMRPGRNSSSVRDLVLHQYEPVHCIRGISYLCDLVAVARRQVEAVVVRKCRASLAIEPPRGSAPPSMTAI